MKWILFLAMVIVFIPAVFGDSLSSLSYSVLIDYNDGALSLKDILLVKASSVQGSKEGEYTARIISFKEETLFETGFNINLEPFYSMPLSKETAERKELTKTSFDLLLPYYANAKSLRLFKGDNMLLEIDLKQFSSCNENKICGGSESVESCPSDCTCGNNVCDSGEDYLKCSSDCDMSEKAGKENKEFSGLIIVAGVLAAIVIAWYFFGVMRKTKK